MEVGAVDLDSEEEEEEGSEGEDQVSDLPNVPSGREVVAGKRLSTIVRVLSRHAMMLNQIASRPPPIYTSVPKVSATRVFFLS